MLTETVMVIVSSASIDTAVPRQAGDFRFNGRLADMHRRRMEMPLRCADGSRDSLSDLATPAAGRLDRIGVVGGFGADESQVDDAKAALERDPENHVVEHHE